MPVNPNEWPTDSKVKVQVNDLGYSVFRKDIAWVDSTYKNTRLIVEKRSDSVHVKLHQGTNEMQIDPRQIPAIVQALEMIHDAYQEAINPPPKAG